MNPFPIEQGNRIWILDGKIGSSICQITLGKAPTWDDLAPANTHMR